MAVSDQDKKDILACEKAIIEVLNKHNCHLESFATLRPGNVDMNIIIAKNQPPATAEVSQAPAPDASPIEKAAARA